jgi:hypothetical protein
MTSIIAIAGVPDVPLLSATTDVFRLRVEGR